MSVRQDGFRKVARPRYVHDAHVCPVLSQATTIQHSLNLMAMATLVCTAASATNNEPSGTVDQRMGVCHRAQFMYAAWRYRAPLTETEIDYKTRCQGNISKMHKQCSLNVRPDRSPMLRPRPWPVFLQIIVCIRKAHTEMASAETRFAP